MLFCHTFLQWFPSLAAWHPWDRIPYWQWTLQGRGTRFINLVWESDEHSLFFSLDPLIHRIFLQAEMQTFVTKIVNIMKEEKLYSWQGGPIILQQVWKLFLELTDWFYSFSSFLLRVTDWYVSLIYACYISLFPFFKRILQSINYS
jgi:hypothetical protein